jgi:hypothetical protein
MSSTIKPALISHSDNCDVTLDECCRNCNEASLLCTFAFWATMMSAQQLAPAKRPITHQDYNSWRSILATQVSRDGKFVAYS